ncbi:hypothetical protein TCAL_15533 [Tigriopus californicus]|uniref:BTB domain-containing protein n=1 Tax=Tigriopus californicus TaxID=6832 RepID=A0A553PS55_TIGCA|nr:uncharacterized protein LOC131891525 isoform X2 [Tigriopus californicus]XP_059097163.1 uncharacterized protein LOC131891570 isoform X2 [Tigriopus californicus]TRY80518.1 hypothetical protein TCAL_15535 [Tigriopus californicus]TRY80520.1 hypothetical protein TCAL_15533 [Tigriopus californicus]
MASPQTATNLTSVQVRPDYQHYGLAIRNYIKGRKSDCVLVCGNRAFNLHRSVLYSSTGLIQGKFMRRSNRDPIVVEERFTGLIEQCLSVIYRGQGIFTCEQLPLFYRMATAIQLKLGVAYHSLHNPSDIPMSIFKPSTEAQENNEPTPAANCSGQNSDFQTSIDRPALARLDVNLGPGDPIAPRPSIHYEDLVPTLF